MPRIPYFSQLKKSRLENIVSYVKKEKKLSEDKLIARIAADYGLTPRKAKEYLDTLELIEEIKIKDKEVTFNGNEQ